MSCPDKNQELDGLQVFVVGYYLVCVIAIVVCPILYFVYGSSTPLPPETVHEEWLREFSENVRRNEPIATRIGRMGGGIAVLLLVGLIVLEKIGHFKK
tara:strand:+ start:171 stop:464 length:294 start_codon:yes stop_codon:yes gene_type:complete